MMKRCVDYSNLKLPSLLETAYWDLMTKKQANTENGEEEEQIKKIICDPHGMKAIYFHKNLHGSLFQTLYDKRLTKILKTVKSLMSAFHVLISNKSLIFYLYFLELRLWKLLTILVNMKRLQAWFSNGFIENKHLWFGTFLKKCPWSIVRKVLYKVPQTFEEQFFIFLYTQVMSFAVSLLLCLSCYRNIISYQR